MNWGGAMFALLAGAAISAFAYAVFALAHELAVWNWIAGKRAGVKGLGGLAVAALALAGRAQESSPGINRLSAWLHKKSAPQFGEGDPGKAAWLAMKEAVGFATGLGTFWLLGEWTAALFAGFAGFWLPDLVVRDRYLRGQERIRRELPETLDILSLAVEGGLSLDSAFMQVSDKYRGSVLADAIGRMLGEIRFGARRHHAWRDMAQRSGNIELREVMAALAQADAMGVGLAQSIKGLAGQMRIRRRQQVEELAHKAPVKMLFPLVLCIFPAVFIVLLGPVVLQLLSITG